MSVDQARRKALKSLGFAAAAIPVLGMTGLSTRASATDGVVAPGPNGALGVTDWAVGGTDLITVGPPRDEIFDLAPSCTVELTAPLTKGPCYFGHESTADISYGITGLPMQLALRVVDRNCAPLRGYHVEVWHADKRGVYSADLSSTSEADAEAFALEFCTGLDEQALSSTFGRGKLVTDRFGRVVFKSVFPGWYQRRTAHIHFLVTSPAGAESVVGQFCWTDELVDQIYGNHPEYVPHGLQDTPLASGRDSQFGRALNNVYESLLFGTQRNPDRSILVYKNIVIADMA
jgi:protocatechuate 3,4-dioxygenase beta subunit